MRPHGPAAGEVEDLGGAVAQKHGDALPGHAQAVPAAFGLHQQRGLPEHAAITQGDGGDAEVVNDDDLVADSDHISFM